MNVSENAYGTDASPFRAFLHPIFANGLAVRHTTSYRAFGTSANKRIRRIAAKVFTLPLCKHMATRLIRQPVIGNPLAAVRTSNCVALNELTVVSDDCFNNLKTVNGDGKNLHFQRSYRQRRT